MHLRTLPRTLLASAVAAAALSVAAPAAADMGFTLAKVVPAFAGDRFFGVPSPYTAGESDLHVMFLTDYGHDPLVLRSVPAGKTIGAIVSDQAILHLDASFALFHRVTFNVDLPIGIQRGEKPMGGGLSFGAPTPVGAGDLRLGARATLVGDAEDAFQLALGALIYLPTGSRSAWNGDGAARGVPALIAGGAARWFVWSGSVGADLRGRIPVAGVTPGPALRWGAAMGFLLGGGAFQVGPEITGGVTFSDADHRTLDLEAIAGARARFARDFVGGFGLGAGLSAGPGTPDFRALLSLAYSPVTTTPKPPIIDRDGDQIPDDDDACPLVPGVRDADPQKNGCPVIPDRDGDQIPDGDDACPDVPGVRDAVPSINGCPSDRDNDGIPDAEDACPDKIGPRDPDPKKNGCPGSDRDGDGIPDSEDACPDTPGVRSTDPRTNGCPENNDRDGDKIPDDKDACPEEKGPADPDPEKNGCPKDVRVTEGEIVILQQVEFDTARATIRAVSNGLLDNVAQVLRDHPEIARVEVQGHTDNRGLALMNTALSQQRAEAVMAALVKRKIAASRLVAKGYGPNRPVFSNITTVGRQKNRRVELHILEKRKQ